MIDKRPHYVYMLLLSGEVVYVGISINVKNRLRQHVDKVYTSVIKFNACSKERCLYWERKWTLFFLPKYNCIPDWCLRQKFNLLPVKK